MKQSEYDLLKRIIAPAVVEKDLPFDVSRLEKIIKEKIPATLEKNAPPNFPELYFDFEYVYSKFYDFLLFNQLIGKKVVALGGGFSSGKSSFLNNFLGKINILPTAINPSTSVPTYVISGDAEIAGAVNAFSAKIAMEIAEVRAVAHGFGEEENPSDSVTLGHLLRSIFVATPNQPYANIAFLDTPGYSKPDSENYSAKTDEKIARSQLNAGDYILWFISAEGGTIGNDDLNFLASLDKTIPKLIILNKTDKVAGAENLSAMRQKVAAALDGKGIVYEDILYYSCSRRKNIACDSSKIAEIFSRLNARRGESDFAYSFKKLFVACKNYYDDGLTSAKRQLSRLNHAMTFVGDNADVNECLNGLIADTKLAIKNFDELRQNLRDLQQEFFTEIKFAADRVKIKMPEPSEIELLEDRISDPASLVKKMLERENRATDGNFLAKMQRELQEVDPALSQSPGGTGYKNVLLDTLKEGLH